MLECLIVGDSIGLGISRQAVQCEAVVQSGISSRDWERKFGSALRPAKRTVISLGTNDNPKGDTESRLRAIRQKISGSRVTWVLPSVTLRPAAHWAVVRVADRYGDEIVALPLHWLERDEIHPTARGYRSIVKEIF